MSSLGDVLRAGARDRLLVECMEKFIDAYDVWAVSSDHCGGELFDRMVTARGSLELLAPIIIASARDTPPGHA